jgi:hypothetical protein
MPIYGIWNLADEPKTYSFEQLHDRAWQIIPAAWVIAKSKATELASADLQDIQILPTESDEASIMVKIKTAHRGEVTLRGRALANGDLVLSQPEITETFGGVFDDQADKRFASVMARAVGRP